MKLKLLILGLSLCSCGNHQQEFNDLNRNIGKLSYKVSLFEVYPDLQNQIDLEKVDSVYLTKCNCRIPEMY